MDWSAITYPATTLNDITGEMVKTILEDVCDNLFNPDPYYQQGGDMVRVGGLTYTCTPGEKMGSRIGDMRLKGVPIEAGKTYKVAGWAHLVQSDSTTFTLKNDAGDRMVAEVFEEGGAARVKVWGVMRKANPDRMSLEGRPTRFKSLGR